MDKAEALATARAKAAEEKKAKLQEAQKTQEDARYRGGCRGGVGEV